MINHNMDEEDIIMGEVKYPKKSEEVCARCKYGIRNDCSGLVCRECPMKINRARRYACKCNMIAVGEPCYMFEEFKSESDG